MLSPEHFKDYKCVACQSKLEREPNSGRHPKGSKLCDCGKSGKLENECHTFKLYYNEKFTISISFWTNPAQAFAFLLESQKEVFAKSLDKGFMIAECLTKAESVEQLFSMTDCMVGTLGFK
jgi:hypothetical protein